jgi:hypothetical protein
MKLTINILFTLALVFLFFLPILNGCAKPGTVIIESEEGRVIIDSKGKEPYYPSEVLKIPPGQMPPPGECRIWYPNRPPGHQPTPGDCEELQYQVPPGAYLIRG